MNLLLDRTQKSSELLSLLPLRIGGGVIFQLRAELELDEDETNLMAKYKFADAPLVVSNAIDDLKQAIRPALLLGLFTFGPLWSLFPLLQSASIAIAVFLVMTIVYFRTMREQIVVRDLLNGGRMFRCDSIVELIHKEAFLEGICEYLRQVLESAKNWDERETLFIQPLDKKSAKQLVLSNRA